MVLNSVNSSSSAPDLTCTQSTNTPLSEMNVWAGIKEFFFSPNQEEAQACLIKLYPFSEFSREEFNRLRELAAPGAKQYFSIDTNGSYDLCTIRGVNGEILLSKTITPDKLDYKAIWSAWQKEAPPDEVEFRQTTVERLHECLENNAFKLNLSGLKLSSLPEYLPEHIKILDVSNNALTKLPELPESLKHMRVHSNQLTLLPELPKTLININVSSNQLTRLPELPKKLIDLNVSTNQLTRVPELPKKLIDLNVNANQLTRLPELPKTLKYMKVHSNQLTQLPELPALLTYLSANDNQLTNLPMLPAKLTSLSASSNQLTRLPELPATLTYLNASDNQLTSVPDSIVALVSTAIVNILGNAFSLETCHHIQDLTRRSNAPSIHLSWPISIAPQRTPSLHQSVANWLTSAQADKWIAIGEETYAGAFDAFLGGLRETENAKNHPAFNASVATWLTRLANDRELREITFNVAMDATASCEDRVTLTYHDMQTATLVHDVKNGRYDTNLPELIASVRVMFRLAQIELIAQDKFNMLTNGDEIEVFLGFQNRLRVALALTTTTEKMRFFGASDITEDDLQVAEIIVKTAENSQFNAWLAQWEPWHKVLMRIAPDTWKKADEERKQVYDSSYEKQVHAELAALGLTGDTDAEREIGMKVMNEIDKMIFESLTERALADRNLTALVNEQWRI
ncbi:NEL-type E3 ubiquitin ligase domain-containing protein [Yersinia aleksiciae]|uniref:RING-type E3 ubiquitin transferase n=1 Tax=Yersinia aleksiciae TaxID=263819 RepID=A0A0T9TFR1_YERAE|nr:NEL-type E3 ubiquitin ligase domain-containing protein [Yersinia aleksiciae]CNK80137.1 putative antigenic leucine-rich repeat protein [Yersinia aleksiciae]